MTRSGYDVVMASVRIADLKATLSEQLRKVRRGQTLTVLDRDTPIAEIVPIADAGAIRLRRATSRPRDFVMPPAPASPTDSLNELLRDRSRR